MSVLLLHYSLQQLQWLSQQFNCSLSSDQMDTHERLLTWGAEEWSKIGVVFPLSSNNIRDFLDSQQTPPPTTTPFRKRYFLLHHPPLK
jgi:hypothetical protein